MADGFGAVIARFDRLANEMEGTAHIARMRRVGKQAAPEILAAVRRTPAEHGSLSDGGMSGWGDNAAIDGEFRIQSDHEVVIQPTGRSKGRLRVLESGRNTYAAGDRRASGVYVSKKTGERKVKTRKVKVNVTGHGGKGTWSDAEAVLIGRLPGLYEAEFVADMAKILRG